MLSRIAATGYKHGTGFLGIRFPCLIGAQGRECGGSVASQYVEFIRPEPVSIAGGNHAVHVGLYPLIIIYMQVFSALGFRGSCVVVQTHTDAHIPCLLKHSVNIGEFYNVVAPHLLAPFFTSASLVAAIVCHIAPPSIVKNIAVCGVSLVSQPMNPLGKFCLCCVVVSIFGKHKTMRPLTVHLHTSCDFRILIENSLEIRSIHKEVIQVTRGLVPAALLIKHRVLLDGIQKYAVSHGAHKEWCYQTSM
ncbi:hypothetical protein DSM106044_03927 [Robinsoniella peoriensis]|uniref:Uncharacterized protein n=1 Tax=Robinsoniella peoriensis TaxID=180332 RepID=A0A4U8Q3B2_9FIRM|nr:hypothetical protein DSM106044_03927 [Robinsoniella peoriensis]